MLMLACRAVLAAALTWIFAAGAVAQTAFDIRCEAGKACREAQTLLPLRALPRPNSNLYDGKDAAAGHVVAENLPAFRPLFVFARDGVDVSDPAAPKGWYQVGSTLAKPDGWMQAKDVMEWRQALVVAYTHPGAGAEARHPVLMFDDQAALQRLVEATDRAAQVETLYAAIGRGERPSGVVSIEPTRFVDIEKTFYVLPVLDFQTVTAFDDETRMLRVAAAVPRERSGEGDQTTLADPDYRRQSAGKAMLDPASAKDLKIDIVFVMDLTGSMGPFIDATKTAITEIARTVTKDPAIKQAVRFGLVGYRDDTRLVPELDFTVKNFTPQLVSDVAFVDEVDRNVKAAAIGSDDYTEEVYAGVKAAIDDVAWDPDAVRFVILVGDASAHEPGHKQSTTGLSGAELRQMADTAKIYAYAVHLQDRRYAKDHAMAAEQFGKLAANPGTPEPAVFSIDAAAPEEYANVVKIITANLASVIDDVRRGLSVDVSRLADPDTAVAADAPDDGGPVDDSDASRDPQIAMVPDGDTGGIGGAELKDEGWPPRQAGEQQGDVLKEVLGPGTAARPDVRKTSQTVKTVAAAALINYLGGTPVRDITFWALDRDLADPAKKALDVRVLVTKGELNNLITALGQVVEAMTVAEASQLEFFAALQAVLAQVTKGQDVNFERAQRLAQTNLMPKWIESLPYRSAVLEMNNQTYEAMQPEERIKLERSLQAKLQYYIDVNANVDVWQALDERGEETAKVFGLPLDSLP